MEDTFNQIAIAVDINAVLEAFLSEVAGEISSVIDEECCLLNAVFLAELLRRKISVNFVV